MDSKMLKNIVCVSALLLTPSAWADWPVALADSITVHASQSDIIVNVLANDSGDNLKITAVNEWSQNGGRARIAGNSLSYTPPRNAANDTLWYAITDDQGRTNAAKLTVNIKPLTSRFPDPQPDVVKVQKGKSIRIDVLKNDIANYPSIVEYSGWSEQGGRIVKVDKQLRYTPPTGFVGTDIFWYRIKDIYGSIEHGAKVTVQVTEEDHAGPYSVTKPDTVTVDASCDPTRYPFVCPPAILNVLQNDTGENLKLSLNSAWSLKGAQVLVGYGPATGYYLRYYSKLNSGDSEDKVWYIIEDEVGRRTWGVVNINLTTN